jgi:hypothetical protein
LPVTSRSRPKLGNPAAARLRHYYASAKGYALTKTYRLLGADSQLYSSMDKGLIGGNRRTKIYGRLDCPSALRAIRRGKTYGRYRVFFADEEKAVAAGFRPCGVCMPDAYKRWRDTRT